MRSAPSDDFPDQVDGGRGLPGPALVVDDGQDHEVVSFPVTLASLLNANHVPAGTVEQRLPGYMSPGLCTEDTPSIPGH